MKKNILDKFILNGKTAVVTGGAGLLGKQFCKSLAQAGANVVVADVNLTHANHQAQMIIEEGWTAKSCQVDVTDLKSVDAMVDFVVSEYGSLDILVNSAALDPKFDSSHSKEVFSNSFEEYPLSAWQASLNVNLTGVFLASQAAAKQMLKQEQGVIINICSIYGLTGPDQSIYPNVEGKKQYKPVDYSVTKAGVLGFTKYLAAYYAGTKMRVNALTPGGIYNQHDETFANNYSARTILGRMAEVDEMNAALVFLASDASSYMTGSNLIVDGGWTAW